MNVTSGTASDRPLNPQLLQATLLVNSVLRDVESLLPQALVQGFVTVSETRINGWQSSLQSAVTLLGQIPVVLIFPPPPFVTFINEAVRLINRVLATLAAIPIAAPLIFPPQPGQATISLQTLQGIVSDLRRAQTLLIQALLVA